MVAKALSGALLLAAAVGAPYLLGLPYAALYLLHCWWMIRRRTGWPLGGTGRLVVGLYSLGLLLAQGVVQVVVPEWTDLVEMIGFQHWDKPGLVLIALLPPALAGTAMILQALARAGSPVPSPYMFQALCFVCNVAVALAAVGQPSASSAGFLALGLLATGLFAFGVAFPWVYWLAVLLVSTGYLAAQDAFMLGGWECGEPAEWVGLLCRDRLTSSSGAGLVSACIAQLSAVLVLSFWSTAPVGEKELLLTGQWARRASEGGAPRYQALSTCDVEGGDPGSATPSNRSRSQSTISRSSSLLASHDSGGGFEPGLRALFSEYLQWTAGLVLLVWALVYPCWMGLAFFVGAAILLMLWPLLQPGNAAERLFRPLQAALLVLGGAFVTLQYAYNLSSWSGPSQSNQHKLGLLEFDHPIVELGGQLLAVGAIAMVRQSLGLVLTPYRFIGTARVQRQRLHAMGLAEGSALSRRSYKAWPRIRS